MQKTIGLPDWFERELSTEDEDVVPVMSAIMDLRRDPLFTGAIAEFFRSYKVPSRIDFALDMDSWVSIARLEFRNGVDGRATDRGWRAIYAFFDIESFALLWNGEYSKLHEMPGSCFSLSLNANDDLWPILVGGEQASLGHADGRFYITPHMTDQETSQ